MDYFDPEGMIELRRTLTKDKQEELLEKKRPKTGSSQQSDESDQTVAVDAEGFDLEKMIRNIIRRSARYLAIALSQTQPSPIDATVRRSSQGNLEWSSKTFAFEESERRHRSNPP